MIRKLLWTVLVFVVIAVVLLGAAVWFVWKRPLSVYEKTGKRALRHAGLEKQWIEAPSGPLAVWHGGSGSPLLLLHGAGDTAGCWSQIVPELVASYEIVAVDLPGHGDSAPAEGPILFENLEAGTLAVVDHYADRAPLTLVGNSLGGWLAMIAALERPNVVGRLVLINGGGIENDPGDLTLTPANRQEARKLVEALRDPASPAVPDFVLDDIIRQSKVGSLGRVVEDLAGMKQNLLDGRLGEIEVPVDLIWGTSDELMPTSYARRMLAGLPAARLTLIPNCGHVPQAECPGRLLAKLERVLALPPPRAGVPDSSSPGEPESRREED